MKVGHCEAVNAEKRKDGSVDLQLSAAEALVLFEWVQRIADDDSRVAGLGVADQAEQRVLWDISASLEEVMVAPFLGDYDTGVAQARAEVRDDE